MRKRLLLLLAAIACLTFLPSSARAGVQDFTIASFEADYYLDRDQSNVSTLRVTEKIVADFPDIDQNHGILRAIPESYQNHPLEVTVQSVRKEAGGDTWHYETYSQNGNLVLKIGDAAKYAHGEQTYIIEYTMRGVTHSAGGKDEFFWDVNGDEWLQQFGSVVARVHVPSAIAAELEPGGSCFVGQRGSEAATCTLARETKGDATVVTVTAQRSLEANETLSFKLRFQEGTFASYSPSVAQILRWIGIALLFGLPPLITFVFALRRWWKFGRDPKGRGVIVPQYVPPRGISVLMSSSVLKEGFALQAISATILDLAVRHYIKIYEETEKKLFGSAAKYEFELVKSPLDLLPEELQVVHLLFGEAPQVGARVKLSSLEKSLYLKAAGLGVTVNGQAASAGYFTVTPEKAKRWYFIAAGVLIFGSFFFMPASVGFLVAGVILFIFAQFMPARTLKGVELRDYLLGLSVYMKLAEAERIKALQAPMGELTQKVNIDDKKQLIKLYEKLLPYAMLFGIEKQWAESFAPLYETPPDWYHGSSGFHAASFSHSLHSLNTATTTTFSPPSSSGSGAGGGGGGGGGGGW